MKDNWAASTLVHSEFDQTASTVESNIHRTAVIEDLAVDQCLKGMNYVLGAQPMLQR